MPPSLHLSLGPTQRPVGAAYRSVPVCHVESLPLRHFPGEANSASATACMGAMSRAARSAVLDQSQAATLDLVHFTRWNLDGEWAQG